MNQNEKDKSNSIENEENFDKKIKLMVIGETRVGKTSLIKKYAKNDFGESYLTTVGIDFQEKIIKLNEQTIRVQIWDTAGQERFRNIAKNYFNWSNGFLLVYDITLKESFEKLSFWYEQIKLNSPEYTKCVLVGNKCDLEDKRDVTKEKAESFSKKYKINFLETSAKDGINVNEVFELLISEILKSFKEHNIEINGSSSHVLNKTTRKRKNSLC